MEGALVEMADLAGDDAIASDPLTPTARALQNAERPLKMRTLPRPVLGTVKNVPIRRAMIPRGTYF
jgi:hypothetical protein